MTEDTIWTRIDEHSEAISRIQREQAASEAEKNARLKHLEEGQARQMEALSRVEAKIDGNTQSLASQQGGLRVGRWVIGVGLTAIGVGVALARYFRL